VHPGKLPHRPGNRISLIRNCHPCGYTWYIPIPFPTVRIHLVPGFRTPTSVLLPTYKSHPDLPQQRPAGPVLAAAVAAAAAAAVEAARKVDTPGTHSVAAEPVVAAAGAAEEHYALA
jgi:hypothetical protein